jgi:hypothetical protein
MQHLNHYLKFAVVALTLYVPNVWGEIDAEAAHINKMYAAISKALLAKMLCMTTSVPVYIKIS